MVLFLGSFSLSFAGQKMDRKTYGARLYEKFCSGCHLTLNESVKIGRSKARIKSAIRRIATHSQFARMSDRQIGAIASVLNSPKL